MRAIGGLAVVAGHTQILSSGPRLEAIRSVADSARARGDWWIAGAAEVADWWRARSTVELRWDDTTPSGPVPELLVSADETSRVEGLWIDVVLPPLPAGTIPTVDGVSVDYVEEAWGMRVHVGSVAGGETRRMAFVVRPVGGNGSR
jgi:hypothetical protein